MTDILEIKPTPNYFTLDTTSISCMSIGAQMSKLVTKYSCETKNFNPYSSRTDKKVEKNIEKLKIPQTNLRYQTERNIGDL